MIFNIGIDIEKVSRFKEKNKKLFEKIFSEKELKNMKYHNAQHLAGLFCAKESIIKACSPMEKLQLRDIEILHDKNGMPYAVIRKSMRINKRNLKISISHSNECAVAAAILMKR